MGIMLDRYGAATVVSGELTDILLVVLALGLAAFLGALGGVIYARYSASRNALRASREPREDDRRPAAHDATPTRRAAARPPPAPSPAPADQGTGWGRYAAQRNRPRGLFNRPPPPPPPPPVLALTPEEPDDDDVVDAGARAVPSTRTVSFRDAIAQRLSMEPREAEAEYPGLPLLPGTQPGPGEAEGGASGIVGTTGATAPGPEAPIGTGAANTTNTASGTAGPGGPVVTLLQPFSARPSGNEPATSDGAPPPPPEPDRLPSARPEPLPPARPEPPAPPEAAPTSATVLPFPVDPALPPLQSADTEWRDVDAHIRIRLRADGSSPGSDAATLSRTLRVVGIGVEDGERVILASDGPMCETEAILVRLIDGGLDLETREPIADIWTWLKSRD